PPWPRSECAEAPSASRAAGRSHGAGPLGSAAPRVLESTMRIHTLAASLVVLTLAAPLAAQISAKKAVSETKSASKTALKDFKKAGKEALQALDQGLTIFNAKLASDTPPGDAAPFVATALEGFLDNVNGSYEDHLVTVLTTADLALFALQN